MSFPPLIRRKRSSVRWLIASLSFHGLLAFLILQFVSAPPGGHGGVGSGKEGTLTLTWIPGDGGAGFDTSIPAADSDGLDGTQSANNSASMPATQDNQAPTTSSGKLIATTETDPRTIFNNDGIKSIKFESTEPAEVESNGQDRNVAQVELSDAARSPGIAPDSDSESSGSAHDGSRNRDSIESRPGEHGAGGNGKRAGGSNGGNGSVSFFGLFARARRIVYAIDASESMRKNRAMEIARNELLASLRALEPSAEFQIIFFDVEPRSMHLAGEKSGLLKATSRNLRLAENFIKGIQPEAGTDRFAAVKLAMSFKPDVVFLLTDADETEINAKQLFEIRRANKRGMIIHSVEFGVGADLTKDSFLKKLAKQNNGSHTYRDLGQSNQSR